MDIKTTRTNSNNAATSADKAAPPATKAGSASATDASPAQLHNKTPATQAVANQILTGIVKDISQTQQSIAGQKLYQASLQLDQTAVSIVSTKPLFKGQTLLVQWTPAQTLKVINPAKLDSTALLTDVARTALANQQSPAKLLSQLASLLESLPTATKSTTTPAAQQSTAAVQQLKKTLTAIISNRVQVTSTPTQADAVQVKRSLADSGIFFEHKLSSGNAKALNTDLKANLGELLKTLSTLQQQAKQPSQANTGVAKQAQDGVTTQESKRSTELNNSRKASANAQTLLSTSTTKTQGTKGGAVSVSTNPIIEKTTVKARSSVSNPREPKAEEARLTHKTLAAIPRLLASVLSATTPQPEGKQSLSDVHLITQSQLLASLQTKADNVSNQFSVKDMQTFASFLLNVPRENSGQAKTKSQDKNDQIFQSLLKSIASVIFKIQWNQISSLPTTRDEPTQQQTWQFDVPVFANQQHDNAQIRIRRDEQEAQSCNKNDEKQLVWQVVLDFDFEELGAMHTELILKNDNANATVWSEKLSTHEKTRIQLNHLQSNLLSIGFSEVQVHAELGIPQKFQRPPISRSLIDVRT